MCSRARLQIHCLKILTKFANIYRSVFFVNVSLLSWNKMASISKRIGCLSSVAVSHWSDGNRTLLFRFSGHWLVPILLLLHFDCYLHFLTPHQYQQKYIYLSSFSGVYTPPPPLLQLKHIKIARIPVNQ